MQTTQTPFIATSSIPHTSIQGDAATRRFGIVFLSTLAVLTIGAGVGIGVGNLAHYKYFGPNNNTNISSAALYNLTAYALPIQENISAAVPVVTHVKRRESWQSWLFEQLLSSNNGSEVN
ncbi:unnamed protein product [Adineta ricciae]|uniref:Uncharacterized protein n=1 Tax=Adineta ricciae TaxID=249248 RepID=A0A813UJ23_ADIRI|nr:unnamed protein product [Adineta ricciae]CAF1512640.1 unnamed protein product [Adineta ricciae]